MKLGWVGLLSGMCLVIVGCGLVGEDDEASTEADEASASVEAMAEEAREKSYDEQYEALKDGVVTEVEYRDSFDRTVACMEEAGAVMVGEPLLSPVDQLRLEYSVSWPGLSEDAAVAAADECSVRYESLVQTAYVATHDPRMVESIRQETADCLAGEGVELSGDERSEQDFADAAYAAGEEKVASMSRCLGFAVAEYQSAEDPSTEGQPAAPVG